MNHQNVMKLVSSFEDDKQLCLVMDLMADDLRNVVNNNDSPLDEQFARKIFTKMVKAIQYCHQNDIVHRDIKMENFLVDVDDDSEEIQIKLTDFGLSKKMKVGERRLGQSGTLMSMAPEMVENRQYTN